MVFVTRLALGKMAISIECHWCFWEAQQQYLRPKKGLNGPKPGLSKIDREVPDQSLF